MKDFNIYNLRMASAMNDKLFFLQHINLREYDLIVDFGCATGSLINQLIPCTSKDKKVQIVGFDINEEMLAHARRSVYGEGERFEVDFCSDLESVNWHLEQPHQKTMIIFSSVLHEVPVYEQLKLISLMKKFTTVVIRDMKRPLNNEPVSNRTRKRVLAQVAPWQAQMFESYWGKIDDKEKLYRFFLMNEFVENFETEVEEDYFSVIWSEIVWSLEDEFDIVYESSFTLPYRKQQVKKRFDHVMKDITHKKLILTKKSDC